MLLIVFWHLKIQIILISHTRKICINTILRIFFFFYRRIKYIRCTTEITCAYTLLECFVNFCLALSRIYTYAEQLLDKTNPIQTKKIVAQSCTLHARSRALAFFKNSCLGRMARAAF